MEKVKTMEGAARIRDEQLKGLEGMLVEQQYMEKELKVCRKRLQASELLVPSLLLAQKFLVCFLFRLLLLCFCNFLRGIVFHKQHLEGEGKIPT